MEISGIDRLKENNYRRILIQEKNGQLICKVGPKAVSYQDSGGMITSSIEYDLKDCHTDLEQANAVVEAFLRTHTICSICEEMEQGRKKIIVKELNGKTVTLSLQWKNRKMEKQIRAKILEKYEQDRIKMVGYYLETYPIEQIIINHYQEDATSYQLATYNLDKPVTYLGFHFWNKKKANFRSDQRFFLLFLKKLILEHTTVQYDLAQNLIEIDDLRVTIFEKDTLEELISMIKEQEPKVITYQLKMEECKWKN